MTKNTMAGIPPESISLRDLILNTMLVFQPNLSVADVIGDERAKRHDAVSVRYALLYLLELTVFRSLLYKQLGVLIGITNTSSPHTTVINIHEAFGKVSSRAFDTSLAKVLIDKTYLCLVHANIFVIEHKLFDSKLSFDPLVNATSRSVIVGLLAKNNDNRYPLSVIKDALALDPDGEPTSAMKLNFFMERIAQETSKEKPFVDTQSATVAVVKKVLVSIKAEENYIAQIVEQIQSYTVDI